MDTEKKSKGEIPNVKREKPYVVGLWMILFPSMNNPLSPQ